MAESRVLPNGMYRPRSLRAGIISKIRLQDFMCHSNLEIELGDCVNFITGQNGSGKSAILTALCVAFGCRAKTTQRANNVKEFIKTGSSSASVHVEIKNQGEDAFKPEIYGDLIILERHISQSATTTVLKNYQGKKVATKKSELDELVAHFSIDVENPCVIMSQDKSRQFLHSGNNRDKFNFFYKATLLQRLGDLLNNVERNLNAAAAHVAEMEKSLGPLLRELDELEAKIKSMEQVEEISHEVQLSKKKLAWSWVYDVDRQLQEQTKMIEKLNDRIPTCQGRIDQQKHKMDELSDRMAKKKIHIEQMMKRTSEVRRMKDDLQQSLHLAVKERLELEENCQRKTNQLRKMAERVKLLEQQIYDMQEQHLKDTQAEMSDMEQSLNDIQIEIEEGNSQLKGLEKEEENLSVEIMRLKDEIKNIASQIEENERKHSKALSNIRVLRQNQTNKVSAFGGSKVISLLVVIERHHHRFQQPPIGPIGSQLTLDNGDIWGVAIENAIGSLFNAFIVTDHRDSLQMVIPSRMLPQTNHPTVISVLQSDNPTGVNVLIDQGHAERQVLVKDYNAGEAVAFDQRIPNLKEVYTSDGCRMFSRNSAQTVLPPNRNLRAGRLSGSYDNQIENLEGEAADAKQQAEDGRKMKRKKGDELHFVQNKFARAKKVQTEMQEKEVMLEEVKKRLQEAGEKAASLKTSFESLCESAKEDIDALGEADRDLMMIEKELHETELK